MNEIKEMKSLTLNGTKYDSFPDQTARAAAAGKLPGPASAKVGQYLKVTQVDESGKVIAVEAADPPAGPDSGQNLPEVTVADAGKFLRVSVDGKWTAESLTDVSEVGA